MGEQVLNPSTGEVFRATDPVVSNVATPADFAAQFPTPLDPLEILDLCEELSLWRALPEHQTGLKTELWREMTSLQFTSGSSYIAFADGACPEEYEHDGSNKTLDLKNLGAKKSLTLSDIKHSMAVIAGGAGIEALLGGHPASEGQPGGSDAASFARESIASLKAKEVRLGMTLVMNGWDRLLVEGDVDSRPLEFDGIENFVTAANGAHANCYASHTASGTVDAEEFDQFLMESCAKPNLIVGHPNAIQGLMWDYYQNGAQLVSINGGNSTEGVIPGVNFGGFINTAIGRIAVLSDSNFNYTASGANSFQSSIYALHTRHNGEDLVYKITQFPLSLIDLTPGCTAISFEIWTKTALVVKQLCAQNLYTALFNGCTTGTNVCTKIG